MSHKYDSTAGHPIPVIETDNEFQFIAALKAMTDRNGIIHVTADTLIPLLLQGQRSIALHDITIRFIEKAQKAWAAKDATGFSASFESFLTDVEVWHARMKATPPAGRMN